MNKDIDLEKIYDLLSVVFEVNNYDMEYKKSEDKQELILSVDDKRYKINVEEVEDE